MKVICAPDSFKDSLTAKQAASAMEKGIARAADKLKMTIEIDICPISDGGEGFVDAMLAANIDREHTKTQVLTSCVTGPRLTKVDAKWGWISQTRPTDESQGEGATTTHNTAIIEMAAASGLELLESEMRDPTQTTTYGTGELTREAISRGVDQVFVGIGGSATTDAGCGCAQALGTKFFDQQGTLITKPITGGMLQQIQHFELPDSFIGYSNSSDTLVEPGLHNSVACPYQVFVACDVVNPLTGPQGAACIYGPQKGATPQQVTELDHALLHIANISRLSPQVHRDFEHTPGAGAAGGMGFGLLTFANAILQSGVDMVLNAVDFSDRVKAADLCLTGEGKMDGQSMSGKACIGVAKLAKQHNVPTIALVGTATDEAKQAKQFGLTDYVTIGPGLSQEESKKRASELLEHATMRVIESQMC